MLERTSTPLNLLDVMQELEILDVSFLGADHGEWIKITDRKTLYRAAITALVEAAESDGFQVTIHCESEAGDAVCDIRVDNAPCDQLGGGCTCEDCTAAIAEAVGIDTTVYDGTPVDLDTHEFTDDCERIEIRQISISVDNVWAGSGKLTDGVISDCGAQFCDETDESENVYELIEEAIADGKDHLKVELSDRDEAILITWTIGV